MSVNKWILDDGVATVNFAYNPVSMTSPHTGKEVQVSTAQLQTVMNPSPASEWSFTGNVYTEDEYDRLIEWHNKDQILELTDHLLRTWRVVSSDLQITDRRDTAKNSHRYSYTWKVLNLGRVA